MQELSILGTNELFDRFMKAAEAGQYGAVHAISDEMCRVERKGTCADLLPKIANFKAFQSYHPDMLKGVQDRIDQYNGFVTDHYR